MQFLMIIGHDDDFGPSPQLIQSIVRWNEEMRSKGILVYSNPLKPWQEATTLRKRDGKITLSEGSFVTSAEKVSAYALLDCASEDEAVEAASRHPMAALAVIELRPIWASPGGL